MRRGYFDCRFGQLHVHHAMPSGGGFDEGLPVLCVHDAPGTGRMFTGVLALLGRDRSAYAPDVPGCGESDPPAARATIADYAAALGDFLDQMRLRQVAVLGLRLGALIAAEIALARPSQVQRAVLLSVPQLNDAGRAAPSAPAAPGAVAAGVEGLYRPREWQQWVVESATQYTLRERLARVTQPVLVLRPRDEHAESAARVRGILAGARVTDLDTPAFDLLASSPERIAAPVLEFLRG